MAVDYKKQGKANRARGARFERSVRESLTKCGWTVLKNPNNVVTEETEEGQHISFKQGRAKYNPFTKALMMNSGGFPDFLVYQSVNDSHCLWDVNGKDFEGDSYCIIGVECKVNGYLDPTEREKCRWLLRHHIVSKIIIASQIKEGRKNKIVYEDFYGKYGQK